VDAATGLWIETVAISHCRLIADADGEQLIADANEGEHVSC